MSDNIVARRWGDNRGEAVVSIQDHLGRLGLYKGKQDAAFSEETERGVINFQKRVGLKPDGVVDSKTYAVMDAVCMHFFATNIGDKALDQHEKQRIKDVLGHDLDLTKFRYDPDFDKKQQAENAPAFRLSEQQLSPAFAAAKDCPAVAQTGASSQPAKDQRPVAPKLT